MSNYKKNTTPITTIWKNGADGRPTLLKTIPGLPYGCPKLNTEIDILGLGKAHCTGSQKSGTKPNETIKEMRFTLI